MKKGKPVLFAIVAAVAIAGAGVFLVACSPAGSSSPANATASNNPASTTLREITGGLTDKAVAFEYDFPEGVSGEAFYQAVSQAALVSTTEGMGGDRWDTVTAKDQAGNILFTIKSDSKKCLFVDCGGGANQRVYKMA